MSKITPLTVYSNMTQLSEHWVKPVLITKELSNLLKLISGFFYFFDYGEYCHGIKKGKTYRKTNKTENFRYHRI